MKKEVKINKKLIGASNPTYIIAEIGANHNCNLDTAKNLINKALEAGVDAVKFQTYKADTLYSKKTPRFSKDDMDPYDLIKKHELPPEWHKILFDYTNDKKLDFISSPFDYESVDLLEKIGVPCYKIASFEITDLEFLKYIANKKKPVIISTGLADIEEINDALKAVRSAGNDDIILLHCNSLYPSPYDIVNLKAIQTMQNIYRIPIGFSDHTLGIHIPIAAVTLGACIIEKHFTLDRNMIGPDHSFALEPRELKKMVTNIRELQKAMGNGIKKRSNLEEEMYEKGRRSIIAAKNIPQDAKITRDMIVVKRPGYGIKPKFINKLIGKKTKRNIKAEEWITWNDIKK